MSSIATSQRRCSPSHRRHGSQTRRTRDVELTIALERDGLLAVLAPMRSTPPAELLEGESALLITETAPLGRYGQIRLPLVSPASQTLRLPDAWIARRPSITATWPR
jgi:hypothetical protein